MLLFQATEDAATPYAGGVAMHKALPNSKLVVQNGGSFHEVLFHGNSCLDDTFVAYLRDGTLPGGKGLIAKTCAPEADPAPTYVEPTPTAKASVTAVPPTDPEAVHGRL